MATINSRPKLTRLPVLVVQYGTTAPLMLIMVWKSAATSPLPPVLLCSQV